MMDAQSQCCRWTACRYSEHRRLHVWGEQLWVCWCQLDPQQVITHWSAVRQYVQDTVWWVKG